MISKFIDILKTLKDIWPILAFLVFIVSTWIKWDYDLRSVKSDTEWIKHKIEADKKGRKKLFKELEKEIIVLKSELEDLK